MLFIGRKKQPEYSETGLGIETRRARVKTNCETFVAWMFLVSVLRLPPPALFPPNDLPSDETWDFLPLSLRRHFASILYLQNCPSKRRHSRQVSLYNFSSFPQTSKYVFYKNKSNTSRMSFWRKHQAEIMEINNFIWNAANWTEWDEMLLS